MAATQTVHQYSHDSNSPSVLVPRHGILTLFGYGIRIYVERGHLLVEDGIGQERHQGRFARIGHGLRRLILIGSDGFVSLSALKWLASQKAAFVMLERDGKVLVATGPVGPSDARLRRAQALARETGMAVTIVRELISQKLLGQEQVARDRLKHEDAAEKIARTRAGLDKADTIEAIRALEARAASAYWSAWRKVHITFPKSDLPRVPNHWLSFGTRQSPLTGSPRLAANPVNAILNYLFALLESEARLAAVALGLDPGIGFLHFDTDARDSVACDLMEPVRPQIEAYLLDWIRRQPFRRDWFFEKADGNCRLMTSICSRLSETAQTWGGLIAPVAEWVSRVLWSTVRNPRRKGPATHLTQLHRRAAKGGGFHLPLPAPPQPPRVCPRCGAFVRTGKIHCVPCALAVERGKFPTVAEQGRAASHSDEAEAKRASALRKQHAARRAWNRSIHPVWLTEQFYAEQIQPKLAALEVTTLAEQLGVSIPYASSVRAGRRKPHPRHWEKLAHLIGFLGTAPFTPATP